MCYFQVVQLITKTGMWQVKDISGGHTKARPPQDVFRQTFTLLAHGGKQNKTKPHLYWLLFVSCLYVYCIV